MTHLESRGYRMGGLYCPERRDGDDRVGFEIVDVTTGDAEILAHVDRDDGPRGGRYRVNVAAVDTLCKAAFRRAFDDADLVIVDEIAPMQVHSDVFVSAVQHALDSDGPLLAAVQHDPTDDRVRELTPRDDAQWVEVTPEIRDELPATLTQELVERLS